MTACIGAATRAARSIADSEAELGDVAKCEPLSATRPSGRSEGDRTATLVMPPLGIITDMPLLRVAFLGDVFASGGRMVLEQRLPALREEHKPDLVIANVENAHRGSGLSPDDYRRLRSIGIDGMTLGDHAFRMARVVEILGRPEEPLCRPANLSAHAVGRDHLRLPIGKDRSLFIITLLGRVFMNQPVDDPFAAIDRVLASLPERRPLVIVEVHMEATSEKAALAHYLDGRVAAVVGTHTHVPTADARVLSGGTAFITDLGMCGAWRSCIGRDKDSVIRHLRTGMYTPYGLGEGDERLSGALLSLDPDSGLARAIERVEYRAAAPSRPVGA